MPDLKRNARNLLADLVSIDSVNPDLVRGGAGEKKIAAFIADRLRQAGLQVELDEPRPGRTSVIARLPGAGGGRTLLLNGHIDTVGIEGMRDPHRPRVDGDKLFGRGAYDMKAGVAASMLALEDAVRLPLRGDVILTAVCDEEFASQGTESVLRRVHADAAVVTEPTGLDIVIAHKGFAWFEVETFGVAAHGSRPDLGRDAILFMGRILSRLDHLNQSLLSGASHALLGTGSLHASLIHGGQELSSYPEKCSLSVERRTRPGETRASTRQEIERILEELSAADPEFNASFKTGLSRNPFELSPDEDLAIILSNAVAVRSKRAPSLIGMTAWTDAALFASAGIPTVIFGPGGGGAHAIEEWANLDDVVACQEILVKTITDFCA
jgi:acetylornithine deacetylase